MFLFFNLQFVLCVMFFKDTTCFFVMVRILCPYRFVFTLIVCPYSLYYRCQVLSIKIPTRVSLTFDYSIDLFTSTKYYFIYSLRKLLVSS